MTTCTRFAKTGTNGRPVSITATFSNTAAPDGKALPADTLVKHLLAVGGGWPKIISGVLAVLNPKGELAALKEPTNLFGWLISRRKVAWSSQKGISRGDFFSSLEHHAA